MDVWTGSNAAAAALLTLPRSDWVDATTGGATATGAATSASATATATTTSTAKPLVLLQLPAGWTAQHLQGSSLVVHKHASLVSERQGCTYAVHTVETSNASVLVRPPKTETEEPGENGEAEGADADDRHSNDNSNEQSPTKRRKLLPLVDGTVSRVVDARLLRPSGSSFLELRPRPLDARALEKVLDVHCPHNGSNDAVGQTVLQLARRLPASFREVRDGLRSVLAYPLPSPLQASVNPPPRFVRLSEQARHEAAEAIVAALHELGMDYAGSEGGIGNVNAFIQHVLARQSDDERFHDNVEEAERVLRFALYELRDDHVIEDCDSQVAFDRWLKFLLGSQGSDASQDGAPTSMRLSVRKVAACVARRLFLMQSHPWDPALLLARWQADLPGVGDPYAVDTSMLRGLAIPVPANVNETGSTGAAEVGNEATSTTDPQPPRVLWKYVPADGLPPDDPAQAIETLFRHKPRWTEAELLPYLERYATAARPATDLLARFTKAEGRVADTPDKYVVQR